MSVASAEVENTVRPGDVVCHRVDENAAVIAPMEAGRAADRRHAEGIAIAAEPGDDARDQMPGLRLFGRAEARKSARRPASRPW